MRSFTIGSYSVIAFTLALCAIFTPTAAERASLLLFALLFAGMAVARAATDNQNKQRKMQ